VLTTPGSTPTFPDASLVGGEWVSVPEFIEVTDKFTGDVIGSVGRATPQVVSDAIEAAETSARSVPFPPFRRFEVLANAARLLNERSAEVIDLMVLETGFTVTDCENDFRRCLQTLQISAEEAKRVTGEIVPIQGAPGQDERRIAFTVRMPIGVVCAITPFNSPLNTVAHKVAPALAAGNAVVLKPSSYVPLSAALFAAVLLEAGVPPGYLSVVFGGSDVGGALLDDQRIGFYAFTGSSEVGRIIQSRAGLRRTQLELGNISATIVCADANLELAVERCVAAAFRKAGQVCTSVQRLLVEHSIVDEFSERLVARTRELVVGDPRYRSTDVGPMIDIRETDRAAAWIDDACAAGARILVGGARTGPLLTPTILTGVSGQMKVVCDEIFAPVMSVMPFRTFDDAVDLANSTPFGLAVGVFTGDVTKALESARRLRMGTIHINDTSSSRVDLMPYGGLKESGFGQEGPRYAIREMTEERLVTLNPA
jgi:succinate-semialdehyde dehydrogenase/glutarate-semialdehyde dehydrogenase